MTVFVSKTADHLVPTICLVMSCYSSSVLGQCPVPLSSSCYADVLFNSNGPFLSALQLERYKPGRDDVKVHF